MKTLKKFWACDSGTSAAEYALLLSGIAVAVVAVSAPLGVVVAAKFTALNTAMK